MLIRLDLRRFGGGDGEGGKKKTMVVVACNVCGFGLSHLSSLFLILFFSYVSPCEVRLSGEREREREKERETVALVRQFRSRCCVVIYEYGENDPDTASFCGMTEEITVSYPDRLVNTQ